MRSALALQRSLPSAIAQQLPDSRSPDVLCTPCACRRATCSRRPPRLWTSAATRPQQQQVGCAVTHSAHCREKQSGCTIPPNLFITSSNFSMLCSLAAAGKAAAAREHADAGGASGSAAQGLWGELDESPPRWRQVRQACAGPSSCRGPIQAALSCMCFTVPND